MIRTPPRFGPLRGHGRFEYSALHERVGFHWPDGRKLALQGDIPGVVKASW